MPLPASAARHDLIQSLSGAIPLDGSHRPDSGATVNARYLVYICICRVATAGVVGFGFMKDPALAEKVGAARRNRRQSLELSQEAFADKIGMHRTYYSALDRGEINLTLKTLSRVSSGLGLQVWELLRDSGV